MESENKWYHNTVKDLLLLNTFKQKDEKPYTAGLDDTAIPHQRKLPKYRLKKTSIPQYRKPPCPPPLRQLTSWMQPCNLKAHELKLIAQNILLSKYQLVNNSFSFLSHKGIKDKIEIPEYDHFTTIAWLSGLSLHKKSRYLLKHLLFEDLVQTNSMDKEGLCTVSTQIPVAKKGLWSIKTYKQLHIEYIQIPRRQACTLSQNLKPSRDYFTRVPLLRAD